MSERYFSKFPLITYNGKTVRNITERVVVRDFAQRNAMFYYPYDLPNFQRADQVADKVYEDELMSWMVYLTNGVTDPYYDWIMADDVFNEYIVKKYGSLDRVLNKVSYYRNNWYNDATDNITLAEFDDLPYITKYDKFGNTYFDTAKRYYEAVLTGQVITSYRRRRVDESVTTNKIVKYNISGTSSYSNDEIVTIKFGYVGNTYFTTGNCQVISSNSTTLTVQHTSGFVDTAPEGYTISFSNSYAYGTESKSNCAISSITSLANNIVAGEAVYWSPVTIYEHEFEKNLKNKTIRLIDPTVASEAAQRAADRLSGLL